MNGFTLIEVSVEREAFIACMWYSVTLALLGVRLKLMIFCEGGFALQLFSDFYPRRAWIWDIRKPRA
jgi:hypothetical protein